KVNGSSGSQTVSGATFQSKLGLKSDWFRILSQPSGGLQGYWLLGSDGGIFSFGNAQFFGSTGGMRLNKPIVGMASTPSGNGYWLVATDGGIFSFGDATFHGSTGSIKLAKPIINMAAGPNNSGYWLVASDGGIFAFDVPFHGSLPGAHVTDEATNVAPTRTGDGYIVTTAPGGVYAFGDAPIYGGMSDAVPGFKGRIAGISGQP